jgi:uncharacterized protein
VKAGFLFDACALIAFLNDEEGAEKVGQLLKEGIRNQNSFFLHEINQLEIYYGLYRDEGEALAEATYSIILGLPIKIISGLKKHVFKEAGRLKSIYKISLADSIALAEAKLRKIPLITCDHHEFDRLDQKKEMDFLWIR